MNTNAPAQPSLKGPPIDLPRNWDQLPTDYPPALSTAYIHERDWGKLHDTISLRTGEKDQVRYDDLFFKMLDELYRIAPEQKKSIRQYIDNHSILLNALLEIHPELHKYFGSYSEYALMVYVDPEEDFKRLYIEIALNVSAPEAFKLQRKFYSGCFSQYSLSVKSHLSVDIRLL